MSGTPSAQYSIVLRVEIDHRPGALGAVASAIGAAGGVIGDVALVSVTGDTLVRDITVSASGQGAWDAITTAIAEQAGARVVQLVDRTFQVHEGGKLETTAKHPLKTRDDLAMAYTPGVARVCDAIAADPALSHDLTIRKNTVAVVTDGTAVLGLGDIGPEASLPVMEGKAVLFKEFAGVDAFPLALSTKDPDEIVAICKAVAPTFGGINLEDISAPRCFEIEDRLKAELDIPVFHDDQHGTAIVTLAALINACRITGKRLEDLSVLVTGLGAAGVAVTKILLSAGVTDIIGADSKGLVSTSRPDYVDGSMNSVKRWYAEMSNPEGLTGPPGDHLGGRDLFVGLSGARLFPAERLAAMNDDAMVFAMANPNPEVAPEEAAPYARIIATGRSDYPNQINNVLAFPGIFRGALDARATRITEGMKIAAAHAIAGLVADEDLREDHIIPSVFDREVAPAVAAAVAEEAVAEAAAPA
ncbi:NAD-dependent malic enzyme [Patulibacter sp. SYSU D01012]|uniref:NAD-dependent malic enzyme n=1 Tax=Patulibacter sp. SYSU D01012 TaxID=2817381 RepID=UPI001B308FAA